MMDYEETRCKIKHFYDTVLTDPDKSWSENRIRRRSVEQHTIEELLTDCYEFYWKDPSDIIFDKCIYYNCALHELNKGSQMRNSYKDASRILERVSYYIA